MSRPIPSPSPCPIWNRPATVTTATAATALLFALAAPACGGNHAAPDAAPADASDALDAPSPDAGNTLDALDAPDSADASPTPDAGPPPAPIGVTTRTFIDTSRGTPANGDAPAEPTRTLETEIWYPALGPAAPDAGSDPVRDAPTDGAPHPLVVFVHGSSGTRVQSTFLTVALARAGYVVAAADFPTTSLNTPGGSSDADVWQQPGDVSFLATALARASMDTSDPLAGVVDATHYAVVGHSTGGTVALLSAYAPDAHDDRLAASVALAPCACFFADSFFQTRALPLLVIAGTDDRFVPVSTNGARAYNLALPPKELVTLVGGNHLYFTDLRLSDDLFDPMPTTMDAEIAMALSQYGGGTACEPIPPAGTDPPMTFEVQHRETVEWVRAFLDATVRGQSEGLVAREAATDINVTVQRDGI